MEMCYDGALVMPCSYAVMSEDEMTYVEGGWKMVKKWYGVGVKLTGKETSQFLSDASWLSLILCGVIGVAQPIGAAIASAVWGSYGFIISRMNKDNSGVTMMWSLANGLPGRNGLPTLIDNKR